MNEVIRKFRCPKDDSRLTVIGVEEPDIPKTCPSCGSELVELQKLSLDTPDDVMYAIGEMLDEVQARGVRPADAVALGSLVGRYGDLRADEAIRKLGGDF